MPAPFDTAQGTSFTFDGDTYACTNIKVSVANNEGTGGGNNGKIDVSTLDLEEGAERVYQDPPLVDPNAPVADEDDNQTTVTISFFGSTAPLAGTKATLTTAGVSGQFKCTQAEIEYAVGDIVKGTATFVSANDGS